jgi:soluble lytic murein transglycosylase
MVGAIALAAAGLAATAPAPHRLLLDPRAAAPYFDKGPLREPVEKFRQGQWRAAVDGLTAALAARRPPPRAEVPPARFLLGLAQANLGRWAEAAAIFEQLWQKDRLLRPYHAYQAAVCHLRRGDAARALTWVDRVPAGSIPEAEAALVRIDALTAGKRWPEVERAGKRFAEAFPAGPRGWEASFATAVAIEAQGRLFEAADRLRRIWAESRSESWSQRADARLVALIDRLEPAQRSALARRPEDFLARGLVLFDRHQNEAAVSTLEEAVRGGLAPEGECRARYHLAQSVWKQRNRPRAEPLFAAAEAVCARAGDPDLHARSMYQRGRCLAMTGKKQEAAAIYGQLEQAHPEHRLADDARLRAAEAAWEQGDERTGTDLASSLPDRYPYGDMVGDAFWALAYRAYRAGQLDQARSWLSRNRDMVPRAPIWYAEGRAEYWEGRILEKQGQPREAVGWYQQAVRRYPLAVYALLAFGRLEEIAPAAAVSLQRDLRRPLEGAGPGARGRGAAPTGGARAALDRAVELARMGLGSQSHRELARLFSTPSRRTGLGTPVGERAELGPDRDLTGTAALLLDRAGMWNTSHALVGDKLREYRLFYPTAGPVNAWALAYPRAWGELVDQHSRANEVPPELQLALMREESAFNPRAESTANCLGLTMVHPATARDLMAREVSREQLLDPQTNLALGARYLAGLLKRYRGVVPAIAAYNAGEAPVRRWLRERGHLPVDEFLEEIPYEETRGYTKRVLASYFAYSWLYASGDRIPDVRLSDGRARRR